MPFSGVQDTSVKDHSTLNEYESVAVVGGIRLGVAEIVLGVAEIALTWQKVLPSDASILEILDSIFTANGNTLRYRFTFRKILFYQLILLKDSCSTFYGIVTMY